MRLTSKIIGFALIVTCLVSVGMSTAPKDSSSAVPPRPLGVISFREFRRYENPRADWPSVVAGVVDLDGDGFKDAILVDKLGIHAVYDMSGVELRTSFTPFEPSEDASASRESSFFLITFHTVLEDLDGDGDADLVVSGADLSTSGADRALYFFENDEGAFSLRRKHPTEWFITHIVYGVISDVPGFRVVWSPDTDGRAERSVAGWIPMTEPFSPGEPEEFHAFPAATWVKCSADLNNDGWIDFGMYDESGTRFTIHTSDGTGSYNAGASVDVETVISHAEFVDLDNDGNLDVAIGSSTQLNTFRIHGPKLTQLGESIVYETGLEALGFSDMDGDGWLDLLLSPGNGQILRFFPGDRHGGFQPISYEFIPSDPVENMSGFGDWIINDVDNDGFEDLVFSSLYATHLMLNSATSSGVTTLPLYGGEPVLLADMDEDEDLDLLARSSYGFTLYRNQGGGQMIGEIWGQSVLPKCRAVLNEDGVWMLHLVGGSSAGLSRFSTDGQLLDEVDLGEIPQGVIQTGDLDGDGRSDLIGAREDGVWVRWADGELIEYSLAEQVSLVHVTDLNGDGFEEAVALRTDTVYHIDQLVFQDRHLVREDILGRPRGLPVAIDSNDLDGDGIVDLAIMTIPFSQELDDEGSTVLQPEAAEILLILSDGDSSTRVVQGFPAGEIPYMGQGLAAGDFDGDGSVDLAFTSSALSGLYILHGSGDGTFGDVSVGKSGIGPLFSGNLDSQVTTELVGMILGYPPAIWVQWNGGRP